MKAVVLIGGEGTRLRPLTETIPKPLIDFLDRPFLHTVLDQLAANGVNEAILSSPYLEDAFGAFIESRAGTPPAIRWVAEERPLGTGGAIANAARALDEPYVVVNGDVLTDLELAELWGLHEQTAAVATIALARVEDARPYGLVEIGGTRVLAFREKPAEPVAGAINAGTYVLDPSAMEGIEPGQTASVERWVFPRLIRAGRTVSALVSDAYWADLGTPERYLRAHADAMGGRIRGIEAPAPFVAEGAGVDPGARLGTDAVVGTGVTIGRGCVVEGSVLLVGAALAAGAAVRGSIVGPEARVGEGAELEGAILAAGARVASGTRARGARVGPGETLG